MYLHLGQSVVVPFSSVIGVFDLDNTTGSAITANLLSRAEREGLVESVHHRSCQVLRAVRGPGERGIYLSQLSTATLLKRSETMSFE
jgi:hypothetical protein